MKPIRKQNIENDEKHILQEVNNLNYSDFEWKLCNRVFTDAVFMSEEYSGVRHLIIQGWGGVTYMITIDKEEKNIRVSYPDCQEVYSSYGEAYEKIKTHRRN